MDSDIGCIIDNGKYDIFIAGGVFDMSVYIWVQHIQ